MKKIYITLGLLIAFGGYSQNKHTEKADKFYETYQYVSAIKEYESLVDKKKADSHVYKQLADSYYHIFNMDKAAQNYAKAIEGTVEAETYYNYAQALKSQEKYAEANKQMDKFAAMAPNDQRAKTHKANPNYLSALSSKEKMYNVTETSLGKSGSSSFGAVLGNDNVVYFTSNRGGKTDKRGTGESYLDIFQSVYNPDGTLSEPTAVSELNSKFHDGSPTISTDGEVLFFARDGHAEGVFEKDKVGNVNVATVGIYKADKRNGKWANIKALPFNSTDYNVGNPSLSKDGKTLYFASDMPGGFGDTDIWKVAINADGTYGDPVNLGAKVNTAGKETFPFIAADETLYFASSGRQGFGGLDVYKLEVNASDAINVGKPVNSEKDDFAFTFNTSKEVGFFSSNRSGFDNIYYAHPVCGREAMVIVKDAKTGKILSGASVAILDAGKNRLKTETTNNQGSTKFHTECNMEYSLQASMKDYDPSTVVLATSKGGKTTTEILLTPVEIIITETEVILPPVYFEFDKSNITAEGALELNKLVKVMNDHPAMVIMVKSHTDTKGSDVYNQRLSERRAQSTVQYVISQGISKDRISGKGFGESEPKVNCGDNCTEEDDAHNRRSEFIIVKK